MPSKPIWHARTEEIRREIEAKAPPVVDRSTIQDIFGLRKRQALRLMKELGGETVGGALVVHRSTLFKKLSELARRRPVRQEQVRRQRVLDALAELGQEAVARTTRVQLPRASSSTSSSSSSATSLPQGISLAQPGELSIQFQSPEELLGRVLALAEAAAGDYPSFVRAVVGMGIGKGGEQS